MVLNNLNKSFGEILVSDQVKGYKKIDWETLLTLGVIDLDGLPKNELHTKGILMTIPAHVVEKLRKNNVWQNDPNEYGSNWTKLRKSILAKR